MSWTPNPNFGAPGGPVPGDGNSAFVSGFTAAKLPKTIARLNAVRAGVAQMRVDFIGDSTTGDGGGLVIRSWSHAFAAAIAARDATLPSSTDAFAGQSNKTTAAGVAAVDSRWTFGAGWAILAQGSFGGNILQCASASTEPASFAAATAWDSVEVEWLATGGSGSFTVSADAAVLTTINGATNAGTVQKATFTTGTTAAVQPLVFARTAGGSITILSARCFNSARPGVLVCNAGWHSATSNEWATNSTIAHYGALSRLTKRAPDLAVIALGVNDWNTSITTATHISNLTTIINTAQAAGGECVIVSQLESNPASFATAVRQDEFRAVQAALAASLPGVAYLNIKAKMGSYATANALGYMMDARHPSFAGAAVWGDALAQALLAA